MPQPEPRLTASDFHPEVLRLFDRYVHGIVDRRGFLLEASKFTSGVVAAESLLQALSPNFAAAEQVAPQDPRIQGSYVEVDSPQGNGKIRGYLVRPAKPDAKRPAVLVVHENRGLNPHIEDVARRVALEDFLVFAPDALTSLGGYPGNEDRARELFQTLDRAKTVEDFVASAKFLQTHEASTGRVGVVGFCYGGGVSHQLAIRVPGLGAAVPFYGSAPEPEKAASVRAPLLIHHAEQDERINAAWPAYESALRAARIRFEEYTYPETQHGFHNDTTPRYEEASAKVAWKRTIDFFNANLRSASASSAQK
jgi:carboxymethylenebutenolidase